MKQIILISVLLCASDFCATAQDLIQLKSGREIKATIVSFDQKQVKALGENLSDTISINRDELSMLKYRSGTIIQLADNPVNIHENLPYSDSLYMMGIKDANTYYDGYRAAATGTLVTSFFVPYGLIPAIACSATPPQNQNLHMPDTRLGQNPNYIAGYRYQAQKIKQKKVWTNFAIGTGSAFGVTLLFIILLATVTTGI